MSVYRSRFATTGVPPWRHRSFRVVRRFAAAVGVTALLAAAGFGLWRATLGIPDPAPIPPGSVLNVTQ